MAAQQPAPTRWSLSRILLLLGGICMLLAALTVAAITPGIGPWQAWLCGGLSCWLFSGAAAGVVIP